MSINWKEKVILLTGGTGSFGQKFTEVMLKRHRPKVIRIFSRDELKQWEMAKKFDDDLHLKFLIGDVRDKERLRRAVDGVDIIVHAAALKQIPLCECNPFEAVMTNIVGSQNIVNAAIDCDVEKAIAISSDKAVNPINVYGATKMCMEKMFTVANSYVGERQTRISCVRYGNVVGTRGSVVSLFRKQKQTGMLSITDKRMTRFWMTLEPSVKFVIRCLETMHGGEIFVPKIPSMKISDLAQAFAPECTINYIGIRPGEKIHECLLTGDEVRHTFALDDFFVIVPEHPWWHFDNWKEGEQLGEGFRYTSDTNDWWLSKEEMKKICEES